MVVVDWFFNDKDIDIKIIRHKEFVAIHAISDQGTLILSFSSEQAKDLLKKLSE